MRKKIPLKDWWKWVNDHVGVILVVLGLFTATRVFLKFFDEETESAVKMIAFWGSFLAWVAWIDFLRKRSRQRAFWVGLCGLVVVPVITYCVGRVFLRWEERSRGKIIIAVADITGPDVEKYGVTETVVRELRRATKKYTDVVVLPLGVAIKEQSGGSERAREIGRKRGASVVVWGG